MIGWLKSMNNISLIVQQGVTHEIECGISLAFVYLFLHIAKYWLNLVQILADLLMSLDSHIIILICWKMSHKEIQNVSKCIFEQVTPYKVCNEQTTSRNIYVCWK